MSFAKMALAALIALGAALQPAHAKEVLCREIPRVEDQAKLQEQFKEVVLLARRRTTASPIPEPCQQPLSRMGALYSATYWYSVEFVTERLPLCDAETKLPTRIVDAVNDPETGLVRVWDKAWNDAVDYERQLITTHELAGVAGQINEPWTTSICWMFVPLLPGVKTVQSVDLPYIRRTPEMLLAGGGGGGGSTGGHREGGGSTGGHGGGDVKMAGFKFRALVLMLDKVAALSTCGSLSDREFETAFGGWLSEEIRDSEAWKATDAQILIHSLELGKGRKATAQERLCLEMAL